MTHSDIAITAAFIAGAAFIAWLGNRFRRFVSAKITSNHRITERQYWFAPIATQEQTAAVISRSSRDFAAVSLINILVALGGAIAPTGPSTLPFFKAGVIMLIISALLSTKSSVVAFIFLALTAAYFLASIGFMVAAFVTASDWREITGPLAGVAASVVPLLLTWMAWRTFQATRAAHALRGRVSA